MNRNEGGAYYPSNAALILGCESYEDLAGSQAAEGTCLRGGLTDLRASATAERWLAWDEQVSASLPGPVA